MILDILATNPRITAYQIEMKTRLAHSTVDIWLRRVIIDKQHYARDNMVGNGLVTIYSEKKWRNTGYKRKEYMLTFKGLLDYFSFGKAQKNIASTIKNYKDSHVLFQHWTELEKSIRFNPNPKASGSFYGGLNGILFSVSNLTYHSPLSMDMPKAFIADYPLADLGYEGLFSFYFLGFLCGLKENGWISIEEHLPKLGLLLKPVVEKLSALSVRIGGFVEDLSGTRT